MRLLVGLVLGLALLAQPAAAGERGHGKGHKAAKHQHKAEDAPQTRAPAPGPEAAPTVPGPAASPAQGPPARKKAKKRQPAPTPVETPVPLPDPVAAAVAVAAVATPTPVATAATPAAAPTAAPTAAPPAPPPARRRRRASRPASRLAVLGFRAAGAGAKRPAALPLTTVATASPAVAATRARRRPTRAGTAPAGAPRDATVPEVGAAAVTRVIRVIPPPLRYALALLVLLAGLLAARARGLERQRDHLNEDVGLLQSALLPELPERIGLAWVSAAYRPAEGLAAGGDFYDAFALDAHRTCLLVGDVAGHGRDAIPVTADVRFTLRAYVEAGMSPRQALQAAAAVLEPRLGGRFVTVVVAIYDGRSGRLTYASAGHPPPVLVGSSDMLVTAAASPAIGAGVRSGLRQTTLSLPPGTTAVFHTDGLTDATAGGRRLGPTGLASCLRALRPRHDARDVLDRLVRESDAQPDDMAACVLRPTLGAATASPERVEELEIEDPDDARARRLLFACGVPAEEAEQALAAARDLAPVVLEITCGPGGPVAAVRRPDTLRLAGTG